MLSKSIISIIQIIIQFLGLTSIILLACQIRSSANWRKKINSQNKINQKYLRNNYTKLKEAGVNTDCKVLENEDVKNINNNKELKNICQDILNYLEDFSISYNLKMLDKDYVYHAYSEDIFHTYEFFKPLIDLEEEEKLFYSELKKCYNDLKKYHNVEIIRFHRAK